LPSKSQASVSTPPPSLTSSLPPSPSKKLLSDKSDSFSQFWEIYPKREAKQDALKAWNKLNPDSELLALILAAVPKHKATDNWKQGFIPLPATFLNGRRWEDEISAAPKKSGGDSWKSSNAGIDAKGREVGLHPRGGESYRDYAGRIEEKLNG